MGVSTTAANGHVVVIGGGDEPTSASRVLRASEYRVEAVRSADDLTDRPQDDSVDLVLLEAQDGAGAARAVERIKLAMRSSIVVVRLVDPSPESVVRVFRAGAWDVLLDSATSADLLGIAARAVALRNRGRERRQAAEELERERARAADLERRIEERRDVVPDLVGSSAPMRALIDEVREVARSDSNILITGESGTGKGLVARAIHELSERSVGPFVSANCVVYSESLLHSELFGHERGAFTGAMRQKKGRFELANGGTIFLDEVGEISPATQLMLLRVLQERTFERVGGEQTVTTDARVIAATNSDLERAMHENRFRPDLFYRLNVIPIHVPSLRERGDDVALLAAHFLRREAARTATRVEGFEPEVLDRFSTHSWPGNVRELENLVERLVVVARGPLIRMVDLPAHFHGKATRLTPAGLTLRKAEAERIVEALRATGGNKKAAARLLGIHRATLYAKMERHGIRDGAIERVSLEDDPRVDRPPARGDERGGR